MCAAKNAKIDPLNPRKLPPNYHCVQGMLLTSCTMYVVVKITVTLLQIRHGIKEPLEAISLLIYPLATLAFGVFAVDREKFRPLMAFFAMAIILNINNFYFNDWPCLLLSIPILPLSMGFMVLIKKLEKIEAKAKKMEENNQKPIDNQC